MGLIVYARMDLQNSYFQILNAKLIVLLEFQDVHFVQLILMIVYYVIYAQDKTLIHSLRLMDSVFVYKDMF